MFKGVSFNVTLSEEQIEEIAKSSADKVLNSMTKRNDNENWYKHEIEDLKRQLATREKMIVEREIIIDRWKSIATQRKELIEKYEEKFGKL